MFYINGYIVGVFGNVLLLPNIWNKLASVSSGWCMYMFTFASIPKSRHRGTCNTCACMPKMAFLQSLDPWNHDNCMLASLLCLHCKSPPLEIEFLVSILKTSCLRGLRTLWPFIVTSRVSAASILVAATWEILVWYLGVASFVLCSNGAFYRMNPPLSKYLISSVCKFVPQAIGHTFGRAFGASLIEEHMVHVWSILSLQNHMNCLLLPASPSEEGHSNTPQNDGAGTPVAVSLITFLHFPCRPPSHPWHDTLLFPFILLIAHAVSWTSLSNTISMVTTKKW